MNLGKVKPSQVADHISFCGGLTSFTTYGSFSLLGVNDELAVERVGWVGDDHVAVLAVAARHPVAFTARIICIATVGDRAA